MTKRETYNLIQSIIDKCLINKASNNSFDSNNDPFLLSKMNKTSITYWFRLLNYFTVQIKNFKSEFFVDKIQVREFSESIRPKIIFVLKMLVYILRNTFNHELYVIDPNISIYLYSNDLDVAYHSYLYYSEYIVHEIALMNHDSYNNILDIDFSLYETKRYIFDESFKDGDSDVRYEFIDQEFNEIMAEIHKIMEDMKSKGKVLNFYKIKEEIEVFSIKHADILRFECYKTNQMEILLAIEILANSINHKIFKKTNFDSFILSIKYFFKRENLYLSESMIIYKSCALDIFSMEENFLPETKYVKFLLSTNIDDKLLESESLNECYAHSKKFLKIFLIFFNRHFKFELEYLFSRDIDFKKISFSDMSIFLPFILNNSTVFELYLLSIDFEQLCSLVTSFHEVLTFTCENFDQTLSLLRSINIYEENVLYWVKFFRKTQFYISSENNFSIFFILKDTECIQNIFIGIIENNVLPEHLRDKIFAYVFTNLEEEAKLNLTNSMKYLKNMYDHFISENLVVSIVTIKNMLSFCDLIVRKQLVTQFPFILEHIAKFYATHIELSLILYNFYSYHEYLKSHISSIVNSFESINFDLKPFEKYVINKDTQQIEVFKNFNFIKRIQSWDKFSIKLHKYLRRHGKNFCIEFMIYHDFFLKNLLELIDHILKFKNITISYFNINQVSFFLKRDNDLFLSKNILLIWKISIKICEKLELNFPDFFFTQFIDLFDKNAIQSSKNENLKFSWNDEYDSFCFFYTVFVSFQFLHDNIIFDLKYANIGTKNYKLIQLIEKGYFCVYKRENYLSLQEESNIISKEIIDRKIKNIRESGGEIENILGKTSYLYILIAMSKIPLNLVYPPSITNPFKILFLHLIYNILNMNMEYDENLIYVLYLNILEFKSAIIFNDLNEYIRILDILLIKMINFNSKTNIDIKNSIDIFFEILFNLMNKLNNKNGTEALDGFELIISFMTSKCKYISCENFKEFFNKKILKLNKIENFLKRDYILQNIFCLIELIDKNSKNPLVNESEIQENTVLIDFLENFICNLNCIDFFIAAQKQHMPFFLFIHKRINKFDSISAQGFHKDIPISDIFSLYIVNINIMISRRYNMTYKKEALFIKDIETCFGKPKEMYLYLITLLRFSEYTRLFTKKEVYTYFDIKKVISATQKHQKSVDKLGVELLLHTFAYIDNIFEDEFYFIEKITYMFNLKHEIHNDYLNYISTRLDSIGVNKDSVENYELMLKSEFDLKTRIASEIFKCTLDECSLSIVFLQFLKELYFKYSFLVSTIDKSVIHNLFNKFGMFEELDDTISNTNQEFWCKNFYFGNFIAIIFYRGSFEFVYELILDFCDNLKASKDESEFFSYLSLIHRIILSEICCCKYTCHTYIFNNVAHEAECEHIFKKRRKDIVRNFINRDIVYILSRFTGFGKEKSKNSNLQSYIVILSDIFISFCENENIEFNNKCVIKNPFILVSYVPMKICIPRVLERIQSLKIYKLEYEPTTKSIFYNKVVVPEIMKSAYLDFGYTSGFDMKSKNISSYGQYQIFDTSPIYTSDNLSYSAKIYNHIYNLEFNLNFEEKVIFVDKIKKRLDDIIQNKFKRRNQVDSTNATNMNYNFLDKEMFIYFICFKKYCYEDAKATKSEKVDNLEGRNDNQCVVSTIITEKLCSDLLFYFTVFGRSNFKAKKICIIKKVIKLFSNDFSKNQLIRSTRLNMEDKKEMFQTEDQVTILNNIEMFLQNIEKMDLVLFKSQVFDILLFELICAPENKNLYLNDFFKNMMNIDTQLPKHCLKTSSGQLKTKEFLEKLRTYMEKNSSEKNVYFACQTLLFYIKKMENDIFYDILHFNRETKYEDGEHFGTNLDITLSLFDIINLNIPSEYLNYLIDFYCKISRCDLFHFYSRIVIFDRSVLYILFEKYFKILLVLNKSYFYYKTQIHVTVNETHKLSNYDDFICLMYNITSNRISGDKKDFYDYNYKADTKELKIDFLIRNMQIFDNSYKQNIVLLFEHLSIITKMAYLYEKFYIYQFHRGKFLFLQVNRENILDNFLNLVSSFDLKKTLKENIWYVTFGTELCAGIGPTLEFFTLFGKSMNRSRFFEMFKSTETSYMNKFAECPEYIEKVYFYTGIIMAKCIIYNTTLGLEFIDSFYLYLTKDCFTFEDLKICDSELHKSLSFFATSGKSSFHGYNFTWATNNNGIYEEFELVENGCNISLTSDNLEEYLQKITEFKLFKRMEKYLDKMKEGFCFILGDSFSNMFNYKDLSTMLQGEPDFQVEDFKQCTSYVGDYNSNHPVIIWFWNYMSSLEAIKKKKLFLFLTTFEKIPFGGFKSQRFLEYKFTIMPIENSKSLPIIHTCSNLLELPKYESEEILRSKFEYCLDSITYEIL
ncbi:putative E3 ubiquitin-protein ligase HERC3 [Hamiltosporidium magnivora]|uniref:HECT-type E3 ubiquitin transferase n=1 Tax=Hamiltosporidium magnivora TaxID=148818 RepID=A0A4Q9LLJ9_9MICR|nr:putative E3 ubiquitin-protein ligase HERC3 [Hamiltosporidium magnivora]